MKTHFKALGSSLLLSPLRTWTKETHPNILGTRWLEVDTLG